MYSISGRHDLLVILRCDLLDMIESVITDHLLKTEGIVDSETMFAFRSHDKREDGRSIAVDQGFAGSAFGGRSSVTPSLRGSGSSQPASGPEAGKCPPRRGATHLAASALRAGWSRRLDATTPARMKGLARVRALA